MRLHVDDNTNQHSGGAPITSLSDHEIVLPYPSVMKIIDRLPDFGLRLLGWEGWLLYPDGQVGHSRRYIVYATLREQSGKQYGRSTDTLRLTTECTRQPFTKSFVNINVGAGDAGRSALPRIRIPGVKK